MGLLLSIFVIYVSVIEFLDVYSNFRIRLQPAATTKDFSPLIRRYEEGLHKERRRILKILEEYRKIQELEESEPTTSKDKSIPSIVTTCNSRSPSPPLFLNHNANHNHVDYNSSELATTSYNDRGRHSPSPQPIPAAPRNSICEDFPHAEVHTKFNSLDSLDSAELQSETFDSTYFWSSKVRIDKKKSKGKEGRVKGSKKHVKFGLTVEELEPDWSRAPSPIFKVLTNSALNKSKAVNFQSLQITDLVPEDYWKRSPSPFEDFLDASPTTEGGAWDANKKTASSDEDEEKPYFGPEFLHVLDGIKLRRSSSSSVDKYSIALDSWDPSRRISSDEEGEGSASYDEKFMDALDGLTPTKIDEKKRSFRMKKGRRKHKRTVVENGTKQNGFDLSYSSYSETDTDLEESIEKRAIRVSEEANEFIDLDAATSSNERNSAENAFWLIFSGEYTKAMNKDWHGQHFCCWQCDESLTGQRYVLRDEHPYCVSCYESVFANSCEKCSRTIGIDSKDLSYKDKHWHEACFLCATCGDSLVDKQFGSKGDRIYCGRCYDEQFASRCDGCGQIFRAGTKKMEYKTRQWHEKCFCCCVCKSPIGTQSFIPREQEIYCAKCYEEKYATRCIKCNKVITSGGVTYKNEPWHRECFTCTHCNTSLAGARFTSRDDKPYCAECFGELFAKRCTACNKPITGIGGTKFISFEDRHWHNDCFFCASCRTSLVGRGFITDADDIICPECAKQKLM